MCNAAGRPALFSRAMICLVRPHLCTCATQSRRYFRVPKVPWNGSGVANGSRSTKVKYPPYLSCKSITKVRPTAPILPMRLKSDRSKWGRVLHLTDKKAKVFRHHTLQHYFSHSSLTPRLPFHSSLLRPPDPHSPPGRFTALISPTQAPETRPKKRPGS